MKPQGQVRIRTKEQIESELAAALTERSRAAAIAKRDLIEKQESLGLFARQAIRGICEKGRQGEGLGGLAAKIKVVSGKTPR